MPHRRSLLIHGLGLTLRRPGAVLWTYLFNLGLALLFAMRFGAQLDAVLTHSLAAQHLGSSFDLGTAIDALTRINDNAPDTGYSGYAGPAVDFILYFLLVPGTLFCYQAGAPAKLATLLHQGILHFWRFLRVTLLSAIVGGLILGGLLALRGHWEEYVDDHFTGNAYRWRVYPLLVVILLLAALLRLYFDLVLAYTVQIGLQIRPNGQPDRRVRRTLLPAFRALKHNFLRIYGTFVLLMFLGLAALVLSWRIGLHTLAQPRVWPLFLLAQIGIFLNLIFRFWQRGAETILTFDNPIHPAFATPSFVKPLTHTPPTHVEDPIPDPEPASATLDRPDENIYHHE